MSQPGQQSFAFVRLELVEQPELVGARWWQDRLAQGSDPVARRTALIGLTALGVGLLGFGGCVAVASKGCSSDTNTIEKGALEAQQEFGWNVGAGTTELAFTDPPTESVDASVQDRLVDALAPKDPALRPFYVSSLFSSLTAQPRTATDLDPHVALRDIVKPVLTADMQRAFGQGRAFASLFDGAPKGRAVLIDLPGPEAVAFAAGLADKVDIVFGFDNWPHPQGVVPAHLTLGAALAYAKHFETKRQSLGTSGPGAPFALVLDRNRLTPYADDSEKFDNRYMAKVPSSEQLSKLGVTQLFHVSPGAVPEADDLNVDLVAYGAAGREIRTVAPTDFSSDGTAPAPPVPAPGKRDAGAGASGGYAGTGEYSGPYYYGGAPRTHWYFWPHHGWGTPRRTYVPFSSPILRPAYRPSTRTTTFSSSGSGMSKTRPSGFGQVGIVSSRSSGRPVGTTRSGSWGRGGSSSGG